MCSCVYRFTSGVNYRIGVQLFDLSDVGCMPILINLASLKVKKSHYLDNRAANAQTKPEVLQGISISQLNIKR